MLAKHEQEYMNNRVKEYEVGTKIQVEPRGLSYDEEVTVPKTGEVIEAPFEVSDHSVTVKLNDMPTYSSCRIVHRIFVSEIAP